MNAVPRGHVLVGDGTLTSRNDRRIVLSNGRRHRDELRGFVNAAVAGAILGLAQWLAVTGLGVWIAQSFVRSDRLPTPSIWIPTMGIAWAIGWLVTTSIGVPAEAGWPVDSPPARRSF